MSDWWSEAAGATRRRYEDGEARALLREQRRLDREAAERKRLEAARAALERSPQVLVPGVLLAALLDVEYQEVEGWASDEHRDIIRAWRTATDRWG